MKHITRIPIIEFAYPVSKDLCSVSSRVGSR
jgi:hypothetical protein